MNKKIYIFIIAVVVFLFILCISNTSFAGELELKNLEFDVNLNSDGTANIVEIWDIDIRKTNTLFKTFKIDKSRYSEIKNVSVTEITDGERKIFRKINEEQYHVDKDCFYGLVTKKNEFEIAWGVHEDNSHARRQFKISYTVVDAIKNYNDCSEFYWQLVGKNFEIEADNVKGTITLPMPVEDIEDLRVWAHGPLNGNIRKNSNNTVSFDISSLDENTMVEVRVVTPTYIYENNQNRYNTNKLPTIFAEEEKWAKEANMKRTLSIVVIIVLVIIGIILFNVFLGVMIKYLVDGSKLKKRFPKKGSSLKYFRDIPDQNATPARAAYMYYFNYGKSTMDAYLPAVFSATILDFALKGIIEFEAIDKKDFYLIIKNPIEVDLSEDEKIVLDLIIKASKGTYKVSTKELKEYSKKNYESVYKKLSLLPKIAEKYERDKKIFNEENEKLYKKWNNKAAVYYTIFVLIIFFALIFWPTVIAIVPILLCGIVCTSNANKIPVLKEEGQEEVVRWKGLKNYMTDFSLLNEKEVPDLVIWEKYLVYATAFGISDKVVEQLKVVYKELSDPNYFTTYHHFAYMHYMSNSNFGNNFISSFNRSMTSVYTAASSSYSSAHGGGGGFSGGGGGRRRRRRRRWPLSFLL